MEDLIISLKHKFLLKLYFELSSLPTKSFFCLKVPEMLIGRFMRRDPPVDPKIGSNSISQRSGA